MVTRKCLYHSNKKKEIKMENVQQKLNELDHMLVDKKITLDEYYSLYHKLEDLSKEAAEYYDYDAYMEYID